MLQVPTTIALNGTAFTMHPLTDENHEELHEFVRATYLNNVLKASRDTHVVAIALDAIQTMVWTRPPGSKFMSRRFGLAKLFEIACHSTEAGEAAKKASEEEIDIAFVHFRRINKLKPLPDKEEDEEKEGSENPTTDGQLSTVK